MSNTELAPLSGVPAPEGTVTRIVNVLPYAYWPMNERIAYARMLAGAKELLPNGLRSATVEETAAKVFLVMETGAMLGLHPMAAFQGIDVIEGSATISPQLFTALVRGAGHKLRIKESGTIAGGDFRVDVTLIRKDDPDEPIEASWSLEDSVQAGLVELIKGTDGRYTVRARSHKGNALNHELYPKDMTQWRALGRLARRGAADVTMGIGYFPEELEVAVSADGVRSVTDMKPIEDALIERFTAYDDKADMATVWQEHHSNGVASPSWTARVEAEFTAHLSTLTKDSRPPRDGAPGNTGDPDVDRQLTAGEESQVSEPPADLAAAAVAVASVPAEPEPEETQTERDAREEREIQERARAEHEAYLADMESRTAPEPEPEPVKNWPVTPVPKSDALDMSALDRTVTDDPR